MVSGKYFRNIRVQIQTSEKFEKLPYFILTILENGKNPQSAEEIELESLE